MTKFISGVSCLMSKECKTTILVKEIDIPMLMTYAEKIGDEKLKKISRDFKKARVDDSNHASTS